MLPEIISKYQMELQKDQSQGAAKQQLHGLQLFVSLLFHNAHSAAVTVKTPKHRQYVFTTQHKVTSQKTNIFLLTSLRSHAEISLRAWSALKYQN
jgi:hypothetical protein